MKSSLMTMVSSLTIITCAMGAALAWVHDLTAEPIAQAQAKAKTDALAEVLPTFDNDPSSLAYEVTVDGDTRPVTVYPATLGDVPTGYAVETWTSDGFSGEITVMVGFDASGAITGYKVLSHAETPGLGAKAQEWFSDSISSRSVIGTTQPLQVAKDGGQVDAITAATITSRAFLQALNRAREAVENEKMKNPSMK